MPQDLESIRIESAENGYMVICQYAPAKSKGKQVPAWQEPERYVYESLEAVLKKVGAMLRAGSLQKAGKSLADGERTQIKVPQPTHDPRRNPRDRPSAVFC